ncbi:MAG: TRAP transporter small permease subunit [Pseudomonadota bacterium]
MYRTLYRGADFIAQVLAYLGGAILIAIIAMTVVSIIGRLFVPLQIGIGPIRGIYDFTSMAMAAAVFAFLPICQLRQGHAVVDLFERRMPDSVGRILDLLFNAMMLGAATIGTLRLFAGLQDKMATGETTQIAEMPVWWGYAAGMVGATGFILVAGFCTLRAALMMSERFREAQPHV